MPTFLTIKEAMDATGKSRGAIRSIIEPIRDSETHPDREHIQQTKIGASMAWQVSDELLHRHYPKQQPKTSSREEGSARDSDTSTLLSMLQNQLSVKDEQLARKDEQLKELTNANKQLGERLHESQALQLGMQRQLGMGPEQKGSASAVRDAVVTPSPTDTADVIKTAKNKAVKKMRKRWWQRIEETA
jgi:hypothetical protein